MDWHWKVQWRNQVNGTLPLKYSICLSILGSVKLPRGFHLYEDWQKSNYGFGASVKRQQSNWILNIQYSLGRVEFCEKETAPWAWIIEFPGNTIEMLCVQNPENVTQHAADLWIHLLWFFLNRKRRRKKKPQWLTLKSAKEYRVRNENYTKNEWGTKTIEIRIERFWDRERKIK